MKQEILQELPLVVDEQIKNHLLQTTKWAKLLAIIGIVFSVIIIILAFSMGSILATVFANIIPNSPSSYGSGTMVTITYLILAVAYFLPSFYLLRFAIRTKRAILSMDQEGLTDGIYHLNRFFRFIGILTIIYLIIVILSIIAVFVGGIIGSVLG